MIFPQTLNRAAAGVPYASRMMKLTKELGPFLHELEKRIKSPWSYRWQTVEKTLTRKTEQEKTVENDRKHNRKFLHV
jgi:hypothetical protein